MQNKIFIRYIMTELSVSQRNGLYTKNILSTNHVFGLESEIEKINTRLDKHEDDLNELQSESSERSSHTLYYKLYNGMTPSSGNIGSTVSFIPYTGGDTAYSGISTRPMSNASFTDFTEDLLNYVGYRVPSKENFIDSKKYVMDAVYKETFDVLSSDGSFISATSVYVDSGTTSATEIPTARFEVTCARGNFKDVKYAIITYNNDDFTRTIQFYS